MFSEYGEGAQVHSPLLAAPLLSAAWSTTGLYSKLPCIAFASCRTACTRCRSPLTCAAAQLHVDRTPALLCAPSSAALSLPPC